MSQFLKCISGGKRRLARGATIKNAHLPVAEVLYERGVANTWNKHTILRGGLETARP